MDLTCRQHACPGIVLRDEAAVPCMRLTVQQYGVPVFPASAQAKALNNIRSATKSISESVMVPMEVNLDMAVEYIQVCCCAAPRVPYSVLCFLSSFAFRYFLWLVQ